ncbi:MAG: ABC transporter ATP-binding protein [Armatimonadetes bacterium]|nr:ABC transporter ATP-binding protein [Armatimonadota bacterium]
MSKPIIRIENIGKRYRIGGHKEPYLSLRDEMVNFLSPAKRRERAAKEEFWALKNVSFSVEQGEAVGIIGRNGAGKSTLLKVLSQITPPTEGKIRLQGRIASLLEVGTGFHPELTGRENIYLNGAILGMTRREIASKFDEIVDFAEVEKFLDTPVKRYSSGMYVRLAFAVAAHLEPEILVVDEVLAVGDSAFQKKCLGKMGDVAKSGRTILFVSHNMGAIENLCSRGVVLNQGGVTYVGDVHSAVSSYVSSARANVVDLRERHDRIGSEDLRVVAIELRNTDGQPIDAARSGQDVNVCMHYESQHGIDNNRLVFSLHIDNALGVRVCSIHSKMTGDLLGPFAKSGVCVGRLLRLPLPAGQYDLSYTVLDGGDYLDGLSNAAQIDVNEGDFHRTGYATPSSLGCCLIDGHFSLEA